MVKVDNSEILKIDKNNEIDELEKEIFDSFGSDFSDSDKSEDQKAAWQDSDNSESSKESDFITRPKWARINKKKIDKTNKLNLEKTDAPLISKYNQLPPSKLDIKQIFSLNLTGIIHKGINSIDINKENKLIIATRKKEIAIFQFSETKSDFIKKIKTAYFISSNKFVAKGDKIISNDTHKRFVFYNLKNGNFRNIVRCDEFFDAKLAVCPLTGNFAFSYKDGSADLFSCASLKKIKTFYCNGTVDALCFSGDGQSLFTAGDDAEIYRWNIKSKECCSRFIDEGSLRVTALACSPSNEFLASGNSSGTINIYKNYKLIKTITNLVTEIDDLIFNSTSEILIAFSKKVKNSFRIIHLKTMTVFKNFPASVYNLGFVTAAAISNDSQYLFIGNTAGKIFSFKLSYFERNDK